MKLTKKQIWQIVGVCALCALLVAGAIIGFVLGMNYKPDTFAETKDNSPIVIENTVSKGIMLTSGVATTAADGTTSQTLTAIVEPESASDCKCNWTVSWKNPSSSWASNKTVTDYVTVVKDASSDLKATVTCKKVFREQVIVTIKCVNFDVSASATVDYIKRLTHYSITLGDGSSGIVFDDTLTGEDYARAQTDIVLGTDELDGPRMDDLSVSTNLTYGDGTINGDSYVTIAFADNVEHRFNSIVFDPQSIEQDFGYSGQICNSPTTITLYYNGVFVASWQFAISEAPSALSFENSSLIF